MPPSDMSICGCFQLTHCPRKETLEEELNICYVSLSHVSTLKFCRFSPHTLHLEKKIEVFPAEGSPDLKISPIPHGRRNLPVEEWLQVECERR